MNRKLFVGNLPFQTSEDDLQQLFAQAGPVESVRVMRDQATGRARGFAFVEMATPDAARTGDRQIQSDRLRRPRAGGQRSASRRRRGPAASTAAMVAVAVDVAAAVDAGVAPGAGPSRAGKPTIRPSGTFARC